MTQKTPTVLVAKFNRLLLSALLSGILFSACNNRQETAAAGGNTEFADSAMSMIRIYSDEKGRHMMQKYNTYYDVVDFIDRQDTKKELVKVMRSEKLLIDSGTSENRFEVSVAGLAAGKLAWKKEFTGTDIDYSNKVLVVHTEGRNQNEEDTYTQYSLLTGEKLMTYTYGQMMALIPNTSNKRFLGYLSSMSATADKPQDFGQLSFVGSNEVLDKVNIKLKNGKQIPVYTPELKMLVTQESGNTIANDGKTVILGHTDRTYAAKDISNFAMQINYYLPNSGDAISILVPVREDHLDIKNATYDKDIFELVKAN